MARTHGIGATNRFIHRKHARIHTPRLLLLQLSSRAGAENPLRVIDVKFGALMNLDGDGDMDLLAGNYVGQSRGQGFTMVACR